MIVPHHTRRGGFSEYSERAFDWIDFLIVWREDEKAEIRVRVGRGTVMGLSFGEGPLDYQTTIPSA